MIGLNETVIGEAVEEIVELADEINAARREMEAWYGQFCAEFDRRAANTYRALLDMLPAAERAETVWIVATEYPSSIPQRIVANQIKQRDAERRNRRFASARDRILSRLSGMEYRQFLDTAYWANLRRQCLRRDGYRCVVCGSPDRLNAHHLTYARRGRERLADIKTLCQSCHQRVHACQRELIGRVLMRPAWASQAASVVHWRDFPTEHHQIIWRAVASLVGRGEVADFVTVLDEINLGRAGQRWAVDSVELIALLNECGAMPDRLAEITDLIRFVGDRRNTIRAPQTARTGR